MRAVQRFFDGLGAPFAALSFIASRRDTWALAIVPALIGTLLFVAGLFGAGAVIARVIDAGDAAHVGSVLHLLKMLVAWAAGVVAAGLLAVLLAQPLSGPALDALTRKQEQALGAADYPRESWVAVAWRALRVAVVSVAITGSALIALLAIDLAFPPAALITTMLKLLVAAIGAAWNVLDYPLSLHGHGIRARTAWMQKHFAESLGLGAGVVVLSAIPIAGLLVLPVAVVAAARVVAKTARQDEGA